jgi:hypothetical protein
MPCFSGYRPQAPRIFHRIDFEAAANKEFQGLENTRISLVDAFFAENPSRSPVYPDSHNKPHEDFQTTPNLSDSS